MNTDMDFDIPRPRKNKKKDRPKIPKCPDCGSEDINYDIRECNVCHIGIPLGIGVSIHKIMHKSRVKNVLATGPAKKMGKRT